MIKKKDVKNVFDMAGSLMPALDRIVNLYSGFADVTVTEGHSQDEIAVDAVVWYANKAVSDELVNYLNDNLEYYPVVEFLKASLDEYTIFQMLVSFNGINARKRVWKGELIPALAGCRLTYLGSMPFDTKGDIYIGLQGKTTAYKYSYGEYRTYLTEEGKIVVTKETVVQDINDKDNHLIIRSVISNCMNKISLSALDKIVDEKFRGLYVK